MAPLRICTVNEKIKVVDVHCRFLISLYFTIGCDNRCRVSGCSNSLQISSVQVFVSQHVH